MNRTENNMFAVFLIVVASMVFFLLSLAVVWLAYGEDGVQMMLLVSGAIAVVVVGVLILIVLQLVFAWITNLNTRNFIAAQQSNDNSDVEKMRALREALRGEREATTHRARADFYDTQRVHKLVEQRSRLLMAPQREEQPAATAWDFEDDEDTEDAEYQVLE